MEECVPRRGAGAARPGDSREGASARVRSRRRSASALGSLDLRKGPEEATKPGGGGGAGEGRGRGRGKEIFGPAKPSSVEERGAEPEYRSAEG